MTDIDDYELHDLDGFVSKVVTTVDETVDDFIFRTIEPFCSNITQRTISKKELCEAITKQCPKRPIKTCENRVGSVYSCPECLTPLVGNANYCFSCGKKIKWEE